MGQWIIKPDNDDSDFYVVWSSGVDAPVAWGTRKEVEQYFIDRAVRDCQRANQEAFEQIAESGSSQRYRYGSGPLFGSWEDDELTVVNTFQPDTPQSILKRSDLRRYVETQDDSLLTPIDWGDE